VQASIRSNPARVEDLLLQSGRVTPAELAKARTLAAKPGGATIVEELVRTGAISRREVERQQRLQIESVIFELMSWQEGFFSFEDRRTTDTPLVVDIRVSTESLLMEGARRIDEWSRIADRIPSLAVVPALAPVDAEHQPQLDLLPYEWEVLANIDGTRDLRAIAQAVGRAEFDVARTVYGLACTGVVEVRQPERRRSAAVRAAAEADELLAQARAALDADHLDAALAAAQAARASDGERTDARLCVARVLGRMGRHAEGLEELRRALQADPLTPDVHRDLGFAAARLGDFAGAFAAWEHYRRTAAPAADLSQVTEAEHLARRLLQILDSHLDA